MILFLQRSCVSNSTKQKREEILMGKVRLNENSEIVKQIKEGLKRTGGYCPCRLQRTDENKCICEEFRAQINDPDFEGYCHCMLYYKEK
jgi:ferredoxin-thioredoxin reductase catalytic subunit